jgi:hypothetical protein
MAYDLERSEGLLLRHLSSVYKVLSQTVPDGVKTDEVLDVEWYLRTMLTDVDSSLAEEWERMRDPGYVPLALSGGTATRPAGAAPPAAYDLTTDTKAFHAAIRTRIFTVLKAWSQGDGAGALAALSPAPGDDEAPWTPERLRGALDAYQADHGAPRFDPEARNARHTYVDAGDRRRWQVQQVLVDTEMVNDWVAEFLVDVDLSRERQQPVLSLVRIGALVT